MELIINASSKLNVIEQLNYILKINYKVISIKEIEDFKYHVFISNIGELMN